MLINSIGFSKSLGVLGAYAKIDLINEGVTLIDTAGETYETTLADVEEVKLVGKYNGIDGEHYIYDGDVIESKVNGDMYEIVHAGHGLMTPCLLNKKLERVNRSTTVDTSVLKGLMNNYLLKGNVRELRLEINKKTNFNIVTVREIVNGDVRYHYACNNKEESKVDLIKVVFIGHKLLTEEDYERMTLEYDEYIEMIDNGILKVVNPQEIANYVLGVTYKPNQDELLKREDNTDEAETDDFEYDFEYDFDDDEDDFDSYGDNDEDFEEESEHFSDTDVCDECGEEIDECSCRLFEF